MVSNVRCCCVATVLSGTAIKHLDGYAREAAYREDTRRKPNGAIFHDIMGRCATKRPSREFCGYWQGNKKTKENLIIGFGAD